MSYKFLFLFTFCCLVAYVGPFAQQRSSTVSGIVKDKSGTPLQDISVTEKGRQNTVTTDVSGAFKISVANQNAVLVITSVGFEPQEVRANGSDLMISLTQNIKGLDEVTVVGYSTKERADFQCCFGSLGR